MALRTWVGAAALLLAITCGGCHGTEASPTRRERGIYVQAVPKRIVEGARDEVRRAVTYDAAYVRIPYPNGDVPRDRGVCTDVVVRALRAAGFDLQKLIHEDMKRSFSLYPKKWGLKRPDRNIDHRRVPNQQVFFGRFGRTLPKGTTGADADSWQPGDIVTWKLTPGTLDHTGVLSDRRNATGLPLVIHNLGGAREEDVLTAWTITGHYRYPK